ncbi:MAG: CoB--CoM heterodisulfide reductase iron-sulfur subunit B family protein, partial [Candidatus Hydrogenedentes bacterium]|nr:CoB--CoM heterodisulfide reductase iron-sulfur subunit B family protein [Candidatus Hydrogenedentota bacterium]
MIELGYYPGCALHGSSNDYEQSLRACLERLNVRLTEVDDWICCGASAAHSLNSMLAVALPARNLGLAERDQLHEVLAPCPLCSMELHKANHALAANEALRARVSEIVEVPVSGNVKVLNLIQVFERAGLERIRRAARKSIAHLQAACYYGCLLTRPPATVQFDDAERPQSMEAIVEAAGAKTVVWNFATECCGAGMTLASEKAVLELSQRILRNALEHGANCLVVACPMCHVNLDMKQQDTREQFGIE